MSQIRAARALAYRAHDVTRVDYIPDIQREMQQMGILDVEDANRPLEFVGDIPAYPLVCTDDDDATPAATYSGVRNDPGEHARDRVAEVTVTPGYEIEIRAPVLFTVVMKVLGVEKARVTAKARPGA